ncbi:MAG TPA: hypothetical protein VM925_15385 [Labilithrix sp.]|jgi:hypothetical protein|nr:hypothetical protein [Labilithrix sp.]
MSYDGRDRPSDSPLAMDLLGGLPAPQSGLAKLRSKLAIPRSWLAMSAYLVAGVSFGLMLILGLGIGRSKEPSQQASANAVTDNVVRLHAKEIGSSCWRGHEGVTTARLSVALEVGIDGKIRYATASGATADMRSCVETHVKAWEFLPQQQAQTMALPFEVDRH